MSQTATVPGDQEKRSRSRFKSHGNNFRVVEDHNAGPACRVWAPLVQNREVSAPGFRRPVRFGEVGQAVLMHRLPRQVLPPPSGFAGFRFPSAVIMVAVRWYLGTDCSIGTSKSYRPNAESRSIT